MNKIFTIASLCILFACVVNAQPVNTSSPKAMLGAAKEAEEQGNLYTALEFYDKVYDAEKEKAIYAKMAELNMKLRDYERAEKALNRIVLRDRKKEYGEYRFLYAQALKYNGKYDEAIQQFEQYELEGKDEAQVKACKKELEGCRAAGKMKQPDNLLVNNAGKAVNSPQTEASPALNEGNLYYTSLNTKDVITLDGKAGDYYAKIYTSAKEGEGFGKGAVLSEAINREGYHQGNVSITPDGKVMYFTRVQITSSQVSESKIYFSRRNGQEWGAAQEVAGINGEFIAKHPTLGELFGESVLFFTSNMPGGKGGDDLYYATRREDGVYGTPVNLGDLINTASDEATPYYRDGKLYFSSNGFANIGGMDVYESAWNGSAWSKPANMGKGINSSVDDLYFSLNGDGKQGFLVSNRPGVNNLKSKTCCDDIYTWEYEKIKVNLTALTFARKKQKEKENPELKGCTVLLYDVTNKNPSKVENRTNTEGNNFAFTLAPEKEYLIVAQRDGYEADSVVVNTVGITKSKDITKNLVLRTEKKAPPVVVPPTDEEVTYTTNEPIRLNNIYYDYDDDKILAASEPDLNVLYGIMNQYNDMVIELSSHTDARGNDKYNVELSQRRAESAKRYLVTKGIATERIVAKGYGEQVILNGCTNGVKCEDDQHRFNRRTEFKILSGPTTITIKKTELKSKTKTGGKQYKSELIDMLQDLYYSDSLSPRKTKPVAKKLKKPAQKVAVQKKAAPVTDTVVAPMWENPADKLAMFDNSKLVLQNAYEGDIVRHTYYYTNISSAPLKITMVSACNCIEAKHTEGAVAPGERGKIEVVFYTAGQGTDIHKDIDIIWDATDAAGYPVIGRVTIEGKIKL
jgi:peptidoglycan-associated lipoprotein